MKRAVNIVTSIVSHRGRRVHRGGRGLANCSLLILRLGRTSKQVRLDNVVWAVSAHPWTAPIFSHEATKALRGTHREKGAVTTDWTDYSDGKKFICSGIVLLIREICAIRGPSPA